MAPLSWPPCPRFVGDSHLQWWPLLCSAALTGARRCAQEDVSRVLWPSSPSIGWASGVDRLTGLPNGSPAGLVPKKTLAGEPEGVGVDDGGSCQFQADVDYNTNIIVRGMGCSTCLAKKR